MQDVIAGNCDNAEVVLHAVQNGTQRNDDNSVTVFCDLQQKRSLCANLRPRSSICRISTMNWVKTTMQWN